MPKISYRCNRRGHQLGGVSTAAVAFSAPPRKVSFEDGHHDSESERAQCPSPPPSPVLSVLSKELAPLSRKRTLVRPKSSMSLVELAQSAEDDNSIPQSRASKLCPAPVSPSSAFVRPKTDAEQPGSPWGQFVDMVIPEDENCVASTHHFHDAPCSCCPSCRRRRANPYGDYKISKRSRPALCFLQKSSVPSLLKGGFRLSPRRMEPAEQLVGALNRLQVGEGPPMLRF